MKKHEFKSCVIVGLGYIGLPTAVVVAQAGMEVIGVDINESLVSALNSGRCPIEEPGLGPAIGDLIEKRQITVQTQPRPADVFVIAVPTPFTGGYKPDLSYVEAATRAIAPALRKGNLVIVESTIPVGATEQVARWIGAARSDLDCAQRGRTDDPDIFVAHSPERVLPGQMLRELVENDRVIGGVCANSAKAGQQFYETFVGGKCLATDSRTAELCKLTENSFRDVNIAFANELADVCEDMDINVWKLIELANHHPRVDILKPGPGVGGHCIAVDPWFIVSALGERARLIREARWINDGRPRQVVRKVLEKAASGGVSSITCFGLAYKANVEDLRESPAVEVVKYLAKELQMMGSEIKLNIVEPYIAELPPELEKGTGVRLVKLEAGLDSDLLVMLVDHDVFRAIPPEKLKHKDLIDTRGVWTEANSPQNT
ncbi:MAG: UDP-N-acetyl-D-mannosamine dehydrogenase [Hyphomicrobiaceae bacterium]